MSLCSLSRSLQILQEPLQLPGPPLAVLLRIQGRGPERETFLAGIAAGQVVRGDTGRQDGIGNVLQPEREDIGTGTAEGELEGGTLEGHPPRAQAVEVHRIAVAVLLPKDGTEVILQQLDETGTGLHDETELEFLAEDDVHEGHRQYLEVEPPGTVFQVEQVVAQATEHLLEGVRVAVVQGGVGRDARTDLIEIAVAGVALHDLVDVEFAFGARADEGHLSDEHVPQLGQFVQMVLAQELADFCQTGVGTALVQGGTGFLRVQAHAAELVDVEGTSEPPDAFLLEDGGAAVLVPDGYVADQEQGREDDQGDGGQQAVAATLHVPFEAVHAVADKAVVTNGSCCIGFHRNRNM